MSRRWMPSKWIAGALVAGLMVGIAATGGPAQARPVVVTAAASDRGGIDASARKAAKAATVTVADLGTGWKRYSKAQGFTKASKARCNTKFGSPVKASDRAYVGPVFADADERAFVYSSAYVFRTEAGAKAFTAVRGSQAFLDCQAASDDADGKKANPDTFVRMTRTTDPSIGGSEGLEAFYEEEAGGKNADGVEVVSAQYARFTFRHGRVVFILRVDNHPPTDAADAQDLSARLTAALTDGTAGIKGRLTNLGL